nr:hypothetical protein [Pseudomonas saponiphila]
MTDAITIQNPRNRGGSTGHVLAKRSVTFTEIRKQANQDGGDDADGQFAASLVLMMKTLLQAFPALLTALGGEEVPQGI